MLDNIVAFSMWIPNIVILFVAVKGSANLMLRANQKRKRTHKEVVDQKAEEEEKLLNMNQNLQKLQKLEEANQKLQEQVREHEGAHLIVQDLQEKGKLKFGDDGEVLIPGIDIIPEGMNVQ